MELIPHICAALVIAIVTPLCYAEMNRDANHTLVVTLINNSKQTLKYTGTTNQNSSNTYSIDTQKILPGNTATITATTSTRDDVAGVMHFSNAQGYDNQFVLLDQLKFHEGQPLFAFVPGKLTSAVESRTHGHGGPRGLNYVAATVEAKDNSQ